MRTRLSYARVMRTNLAFAKYKKNPTFARDAGFFFTNNRYFAPIANCTMRVASVLFFAFATDALVAQACQSSANQRSNDE